MIAEKLKLRALKAIFYMSVTNPHEVAKSIFMELKEMPYFRNYAAASGAAHNISTHEKMIEEIFKKYGLESWVPSKKLSKEQIWDFIENPLNAKDMPDMTYIAQPCGTHDNPDFLIKFVSGIVLGVESKTSDGYFPLYNSGGVTQKYIYIFSSQRANATTIYLGRDIMTSEQQTLLDKHIDLARQQDALLNEKLSELDTTHRGIYYYTRPMIGQQGGAEFTNYFTHEKRAECEGNVFKFIEDMFHANA